MGIGSYKEAERYRMRTNKNLTRTFYLDTKRTLNDEPFAWEQVQNTPAPETDYNTGVDSGMVVPPQDILPKNPIPNMPSAPGIPDPQFRQFELANGGRVNFSEGSKLTGTDKTLEQNIKDDHKAFNDYRKSIGQSTIPLDNAFIKMWQRTRLSEGGRVESLIRDRLEKRFNAAETLSDKKQAINLFKKELENKAPNIVSQPGKKAYGVETDVEGLLKTSKVPAGERKKVINNLTKYLNNNPEEVKAFRTAGVVCRRSVGGKVDTECLAENIIKETEKLETGTDLQKASALNKFKNATKLGAGLAEEVIGFGKGVAGRTLGPLVALNSALEQFTSGNYREGIRKIADIADLTTLIGDPLGFEKMRTEGTIEDVRGKIGKENQASLDRILEFKDKYYQLQDVNTKLQRAESAAAGQYDPESPGVDPNYLNELKKQQADLNKIINSSKYQNIRTDYLNVGNAVKNEIFGRNINAPEQNKYTFETAAQEQLKSILGYDFYDELSDENKIIFKNLTASEKIKRSTCSF
jgi:hypothetical protein